MLIAQLKCSSCAFLFLFFSFGVFAADVATITLDNGAKVRLKDDFTWEYVLTTLPAKVEPVATPSLPGTPANLQSAHVALPAAVPMVDTAKNVARKTSPMNTNSLLQAGLLASAAKEGVKVSFIDATWRENEVGLNFELSSTNSDGVVIVEVELTLYDDKGHQLKQINIRPWLASFRQPDTYLRKGQTRPSRTIWLEDIDQQRWSQKLLSLKVIDVETR